ncbi:ATPase [Pseudomonas phage vB_PseuGesM_254]|uniref:ATPase n=1 Tax=Pseudomonas phage vB_PseuGesM_254 TaxID=3092638 RepID=A0AAX4G6K6_9CAUD|nr:ATPase [Pseudomonas phage PseuGes_254]
MAEIEIKAGDKIMVTSCTEKNWYCLGEEYVVEKILYYNDGDVKGYQPISAHDGWILAPDAQKIFYQAKVDTPHEVQPTNSWTASHYDTYYELTKEDIAAGKVKLDTYLVAKVWKVGSKDDSGALWHSLKTINRFGQKNDVSREIQALYAQAKALARIYGVKLND